VPSVDYTPRDAAAAILYGVVREHFETFRAFLHCGVLAGGFARFRCGACRAERRMAERAAHLV